MSTRPKILVPAKAAAVAVPPIYGDLNIWEKSTPSLDVAETKLVYWTGPAPDFPGATKEVAAIQCVYSTSVA